MKTIAELTHIFETLKDLQSGTYVMKGAYERKNKDSQYLVCADGQDFGETTNLIDAVEIAYRHRLDSELKIHEFHTGLTWVF